MVYKTNNLFAKLRKLPRKYLTSGFRDSLKIIVSGGSGGNGLPKFGGVGGQGGNVIVRANENITLEDVYRKNKSKTYMAPNGRNSSHNFILGPPGEDVLIEVPVGVTMVTELGKKLGELNLEGEEIIIAKGGTGGHPKNGFLGTKGQGYPVRLDLKLIADIGLVGFPNAGKSTLLKAISNAKPKIASYPFTTIKPNLGILMYKDFRQISMADLPGLIEGAHLNKGMGHRFLRHVERTKLLLLIVDINGFQLSPQYPKRTCLDTVVLLNKELEMYNPDLLNKPSVILVNKMDSVGAKDQYKDIKNSLNSLADVLHKYPQEMRPEKALTFSAILPISAKESHEDIDFVKLKLRTLLDAMAELEKGIENANPYLEIREDLREKGPSLV